jgi:hypothetical protein
MLKKFKPLAHSDEFGYAYDSQAMDFNAPFLDHFRIYHTYGHDLVQHSPDWSVTVDQAADYLASLAEAMKDDQELLEAVRFHISRRPSRKEIEFAASIKWKEDSKVRYFSVAEQRISSSDSKRHDKRYQEIGSQCDGTAQSIFRILVREYAAGLERYCYAHAIREWCLENGSNDDRPYMQLPGLFMNWFKSPAGRDKREEAQRINDGYEACWYLVQASYNRAAAEAAIRNYQNKLHKTEPTPESSCSAE